MKDFWNLIADQRTDPVLLRVYRWMLQWPESVAFATLLDPEEVARATRLSPDAVRAAIEQLVADGHLSVQSQRPDGALWVILYYNGPLTTAVSDAPAERAKKIPPEQRRAVPLGLRWKVLERDGRKCRTCGHGVEHGAKLVIDHIKPFSKGGLTTEDNLQVLCQDCNAGKLDRWPDPA